MVRWHALTWGEIQMLRSLEKGVISRNLKIMMLKCIFIEVKAGCSARRTGSARIGPAFESSDELIMGH
ncbi:hypothetical protein D3C81_1751040 [compost metagenome]